MPTMRVITTAGHVDHGKSALVQALTGTDPDRFAEERERGLTIDLGFAWCPLPSGVVAAFVDVPGHERFVANMLAGAGAAELALLVVAADEGWMPQSSEHRDILDLLGVGNVVVALTKADLVDDDTLALATELVREELAGTSAAGAPIVPVSAVTGAGLDELRKALDDLVTAAPAPVDAGRPRLWVDRVFTVRGAGTVVTGTLAGGALAIGDAVVVCPGHIATRIRGLQQLGEDVPRADPGSRLAVNLAGVPREAVERGAAVLRSHQWQETTAVEAHLRTVGDVAVDRQGAWHLHVGSARRLVRVLPTGVVPIEGEGPARLELDAALPLAAGDRLVLRESGRWTTVAGGVVLDPQPPSPPRGRAARTARLRSLARRHEALTAGDDAALLSAHLAEHGLVTPAVAAALLGLDESALEVLRDAAGARRVGSRWADAHAWARWCEAAVEAVTDDLRRRPSAPAASRDVADRALRAGGCPPGTLGEVIDQLVADGLLEVRHGGLVPPGHEVRLPPEAAAARDALLQRLRHDPLQPPRLSDAAREAGVDAELLRSLEATGALVRLAEDVAVAPEAVDAAADRLRRLQADEGPFTAARAKEVLGTTRRVAVPLLEHLDRHGITRREGDLRTLRT